MTKAISKSGYFFVAAALLCAFALTPQAQSRVATAGSPKSANSPAMAAEPTPDEFTEQLIGELEQSGFAVSQGEPKLYTQDDCIAYTYPKLKNCFLANPAAPYVLPIVKSWPDEYVDPGLVDAFVDTDPGYSGTFRLDQREAVVIYGQMPPPGRYMGLQTFEFSEHGRWKSKDYNQWANTADLAFPIQYLFNTVPPKDPTSHRIISASALGDVVNNVVMERALKEYDPSDYSPFGKTLYFIITPSDSTDKAIRLALQAQGVPDSYIFTEQIPREDEFGPIGPIGMGKNAIDFISAFRYAVPENEDAAKAWRKRLPLTVLRVRAPASLGPVQRYKSLIFEPRKANTDETDDLANGLVSDVQNLVDAVCSSLISSGLGSNDCGEPAPASSFLSESVRDYGWAGPYCRSIGMNCMIDQQESGLFFSSPRPTDSGQVYAVVGTLATETDNAIYVGLSANDASIMGGVPDATILDTDLKGSAEGYTDTLDNASKFFVRYFTTDCAVLESVLENVAGGMKNCTEISGMSEIGDPALQGMIIISLRDYIAPGTQRGPDASQLLTPRILTFTP